MLLIPQVPYVSCMKTSIDELVVFCSECEHSEFVHADRGNQLCLFSDCECSGLDEVHRRPAASQLREADDASATTRA